MDHRHVRRLGTLVEPLAAAVYFAPEATAAYQQVAPDVGSDFWAPYYASRGASLGDTPAAVVAAAFGVFNPEHIVENLAPMQRAAPAARWWEARVQGATAQLERLLGAHPEGAQRATELLRRVAGASIVAGRPFFAGLSAMPWPGTVIGDLWHAADLVREHRGDTHTATWTTAGLSAPEIMMLTELWWGLPHGLYLASRHWDPATIALGLERLRREGWVEGEPPAISDLGIQMRAGLEKATDAAEAHVLSALSEDERDELFAILQPIAATICAGGGYPADPNERTLRGLEA